VSSVSKQTPSSSTKAPGLVTNKPTATKSGQTTTKSVDYAQLSQSQKDEMNFTFTRNDATDMSSVSLKVVNRTSEDVLFDGTRFILAHTQGSDVTSTKGNTIRIKSNSTKTVKNLFSGIDKDVFKTVGLFYYKNSKNKLAYSEANATISESTNLKDENLQKSYKGTPKKKVTRQKKTTTDNDPAKADQTEKNRRPTNQIPTGPITNAKDAVALVRSQMGPAPENMAYTYMSDETSGANGSVQTNDKQTVYWVRLYRTGLSTAVSVDDWTVYPDRTIVHLMPSEIGTSSDDTDSDNSDDTDNNDNNLDSNDDYQNDDF